MIEVIEIPAAQTFPLRALVLRADIPVEQVDFGDDKVPDSRHFGAFTISETEGELVGAGYISPISEPNDSAAQQAATAGASATWLPGGWQLRGMSVRADQRGRGIGNAVLQSCITAARAENAPVLWCNARVRAVPLYQRAGFEIVSEVFEIAGVGPHLRMRLDLRS